MKQTIIVAAIFSLFAAQTCLAQGRQPSSTVPIDDVARLMESTQSDLRAAETTLAPIRSRVDLDGYLAAHPTSAFNAFSERSLDMFLRSLYFSKVGLASYRTAEIEAELTPREAYALLSLFGVQGSIVQLTFQKGSGEELEALRGIGPGTDDDHSQYRCVPPATCITAMDMICIGQICRGGVP
jgi:hypothetical protein